MRRNSLAFRLVAAASLWTVAALVAAGLILTSLYQQTVETAFDERLSVYMRTLVGSLAAQENPSELQPPDNLGEPRFELTYSGWYWQVSEPDGGPVILASPSLFTDTLDFAEATDQREINGMAAGDLSGPDDQALHVLELTVDLAADYRYEVLVAGDAGELANQVANFRVSVFLTLAVFGIGLVLATTMQIRWGLRPLDRVRSGLAALRSGQETRFEGGYPAEIAPLVAELNALIEANQQVIERARTQVGNLAHALKTPLSVITNEARSEKGQLADKVIEQAAIMQRQMDHYLDRARIAARSKVIGVVTEVEPVLQSLVRAMRRIHEGRDIAIAVAVPENARFKGEKQDLEELVGNLVDNACKWARSAVAISVDYRPPEGDAAGHLTLTIDDDGPGLTEAQRKEATRRGKRLDESKPGSGLGLSIVTDLVQLYEGNFSLGESPDGGLRALVELPAA